jgi:hypothetical protein
MTGVQGKDYYKDCVNYPAGHTFGGVTVDSAIAFRYDTEPVGDKFCFPAAKQQDPNIVAMID